MSIDVSITFSNGKRDPILRPDRGKSIISFPDSFVVLDLETTGLDSLYDDIIEICAVKVSKGSIEKTFSSLVNPRIHIDEFIEELTGITDDMVKDAPYIEDVLPSFLSFIGDQVLIGHHVSFDVNFLYDSCTYYLKTSFPNSFVDTMRIFRKLHPELDHHRLSDMTEYYSVPVSRNHRAEADCLSTLSCFNELHNEVLIRYPDEESFCELFKPHNYNLDLSSITTEKTSFDSSNPFYQKHCVFTGALERMSRREAAQLVADFGGIPDNGITKQTNFLILGNTDYCSNIKNGKSNKLRKAEEYILKGLDLTILSEQVFYEMISS